MAQQKKHIHESSLEEVKAQKIWAIQDFGHHRNGQLLAGITEKLKENSQCLQHL